MVAEGVEHQDQFDLLRNEGCDEFQGFFCAKPLEEDDLLKFLAARARAGDPGQSINNPPLRSRTSPVM